MLKYINPNFDGVMDRGEYALTVVIGFIVTVILMLWSSVTLNSFGTPSDGSIWWAHFAIYMYYTALIAAASMKRARDCMLSPAWGIMTIVPWFGIAIMIVLVCIKSKRTAYNEY